MKTELEKLSELEMSNQQLLEENYSLRVTNSELEQKLEYSEQEVQDLRLQHDDWNVGRIDELVYHASKECNKYHRPDCRWAKEISPSNLLVFTSHRDAVDSPYKPCGECKP